MIDIAASHPRHAGLDPASSGQRARGLDACFRKNDGRLHSIVIGSSIPNLKFVACHQYRTIEARATAAR